MKIEKDIVVTLGYELHSSSGNGEAKFVEKTSEDNPFVFLFGSGGLLKEFEDNLLGKIVGDTFDFRITSSNAYGPFDLESIVDIPKEAFKDAEPGMLQVGKTIPMMDNEGHHLHGTVREIKENSILMDFNHPLAGQDLHFKGKIAEIRPATSEELSHGHVHGKGGHHH